VALAEMAFAGGLGINADLRGLPTTEDCVRTDAQLFSESNSRYIVEVAPSHFHEFASLMSNVPFGQIGEVTHTDRLTIRSRKQQVVVDCDLASLKQAWQKPLAWK